MTFCVVHANYANCLMADGSVKELNDLNGERFFNSSFLVTPNFDVETDGYTSNVCEVDFRDVFFGVSLSTATITKGVFEDE